MPVDLSNAKDFEQVGAQFPEVPEGWYLFACEDVSLSDNPPGVRLKMTAERSTVPTAVGMVHGEPVPSADNMGWKRERFAKAFGLIKPEHIGQRVSPDWEECIGRRIVGKVESRKKDGKTFQNITEAYAPTDTKAAPALRAMAGIAPAPSANGTPAAAPAPAMAAAGNLDDI